MKNIDMVRDKNCVKTAVFNNTFELLQIGSPYCKTKRVVSATRFFS